VKPFLTSPLFRLRNLFLHLVFYITFPSIVFFSFFLTWAKADGTFTKSNGFIFYRILIDNHLYKQYNIDADLCEVILIIDVSLIFKALGDSNRLQIVKLLSEGEKCACKLLEAFKITQPTLSHHMQILSECGLVQTRKEGKWSHYSLSTETITALIGFFSSIECPKGGSCKCL